MKTRDKLLRILAYMHEHTTIQNKEISALLGVGDDRVRVLLKLLTDHRFIRAEGYRKERTYSLITS